MKYIQALKKLIRKMIIEAYLFQKWFFQIQKNYFTPVDLQFLAIKNFFSDAYNHVCVYAFKKFHLSLFSNEKEKTFFEMHEDLEINRFLELDITVRCIELKKSGKALDTKEDLIEIKRKIFNNLRN